MKDRITKALNLACKELADQHGCPCEILHPDFEINDGCAGNCSDREIWECWKEYFLAKTKEA